MTAISAPRSLSQRPLAIAELIDCPTTLQPITKPSWKLGSMCQMTGVEVNRTLEDNDGGHDSGDFRRYAGSSGQPTRSMSRGPFAALAPGPE
jgi:hypothetical protein